jgi:DNA-binding MarR family transcriptional regulator
MATIDPLRKFAEQSLRIERILDEHNVSGSAARVTFILSAANKIRGVSQKQVVKEAGLPKDVISKIVGSLVRAGLVAQLPQEDDPRAKRLCASDAGKALLAEMKIALQPCPPAGKQPQASPGTGPKIWDVLDTVAD